MLKTIESSDGEPLSIKLNSPFTTLIAIYFSGSAGTLEIKESGTRIFKIRVPEHGFIPLSFSTKNLLEVLYTPDSAAVCNLNIQID
jgi:hypothetical protein